MLSLQLKSGEYLTIGDDIVVQVFEQGGTIRVAVKAPRELPILRGEVHERDGQRPDVRYSPAGWSGGRRTTFWMGRKEALTLT